MGMASFWGGAASATDESLRRWQEIILAREAQDEQRRQFDASQQFAERQQTFIESEAQTNRDWQLELEQMRQQFETGMLDRQAIYQQGNYFLESAMNGQVPLDAIEGLSNQFLEMGNPFVGNMLPMVASYNFFNSPEMFEGWMSRLIEAASNPEATMHIPEFMVGAARNHLASFTGMSSDEFDEQFMPLVEAARELESEIRPELVQQIQTRTKQAQANLGLTEQQTRLASAQESQLWKEIEEIIPLQARQLESFIARETAQTNMLNIETEFLPTRLYHEIRQAATDTATGEVNLEILQKTKDAAIDLFMLQFDQATVDLGISELQREGIRSDLNVQLATEGALIALRHKQVEHLEAEINQLVMSVTEAEERIRRSQFETGQMEQEMELLWRAAAQDTMTLLTEMVRRGDRESVNAFGPELLDMLGLANPREVLNSFLERATEEKSKAQLMYELEMSLATAERDLKRFQADIAPEDYQRTWNLRWAEHDLAKQELAIRQADLALRRAQANKVAPFQYANVFDAIGTTGNQYRTAMNDLLEATTAKELIENIQNQTPLSDLARDKFNSFVALTDSLMAQALQELGLPPNTPLTDQVLMAVLPPDMRNLDGDLTKAILQTLGYQASEQADNVKSIDPSNVQDMAKLVLDLEEAEGVREDPASVAAFMWDASPELQEQYPEGPKQLEPAVTDTIEDTAERRRDYERAHGDAAQLASQLLGIHSGGNHLMPTQLSQAYQAAESRINAIQPLRNQVDGILQRVEAGEFTFGLPPEIQQEVESILEATGQQIGRQGTSLPGVMGQIEQLEQAKAGLSILQEALRDLQNNINTIRQGP